MSEEEKLVEGWKKAQEMEHTACVDLNGAYDALVDAKKSQGLTINRWKSMTDQFGFPKTENEISRENCCHCRCCSY